MRWRYELFARLCRTLSSGLPAGLARAELSAAPHTPSPLTRGRLASTKAACDALKPLCNAAAAPGRTQSAPMSAIAAIQQPSDDESPPQQASASTEDTGTSRDISDLPPSLTGVAEGPGALYCKGRREGLYRQDAQQTLTVEKLQKLFEDLRRMHPPPRRRRSSLTVVDSVSQPHNSWWADMFSGGEGSGSRPAGDRPQGMYMYGGVGVGKTMLMDLLVHAAPPEFQLKRTHFHDFMLDVHRRLRGLSHQSDPLAQVAVDICDEIKVLALDEFFVTDVADAVILARLFSQMWDRGLVLVATSNRRPDVLYEGGLQRMLFLPFIERLKAECQEHDMVSVVDYRRLAQHRQGLYFTGPDACKVLMETFKGLTVSDPIQRSAVAVEMGRTLAVPRAGGCIAHFNFMELCGCPVAAADYIALVMRYHSLALAGIPTFSAATRVEAHRFMILVDVLYEHKTRFFCSAQAMPFELFENIVPLAEGKRLERTAAKARLDALVVDDNLGFTKDRTISRLIEMQSLEYLMTHAEAHAPELLLALHDRKMKGASAASSSRHERAGLRGSAGAAFPPRL